MMDGGDLTTQQRLYKGGDLSTESRQNGGFIIGPLLKLFGLGAGDLQSRMSEPSSRDLLMQRGGFPWALAGLSLLPMLLGKGKMGGDGSENVIERQMRLTREPAMQRGGLTIPPGLLAKGIPLLKSIGIPLAMGALASVGDNVVDKVFGDGPKTRARTRARGTRKVKSRGKSKGRAAAAAAAASSSGRRQPPHRSRRSGHAGRRRRKTVKL